MRTALHEPKDYRAIMLSSTFADLKEHRQKAIEAIHKFGLKTNVTEQYGSSTDVHIIESSLQKVRDSVAYIGIVSRKYGQIPFDPLRNPSHLSITELEFNEALRLNRPILLFIMGEKHPVTEADIELNPDNRKKLDAFRERAKRMGGGGEIERVYAVFDNVQDFIIKAANAVGGLTHHLGPSGADSVERTASASETETTLPHPPALAALPPYLGSHSFVGRASELQTLTDWCGAADPNPMLLFEAMGGLGKSMLTWEWLTKHATTARGDWAGRFWFSFSEEGAIMASFCRQALAYMTMKPVEKFAKLRTPALSDLIIAELERRPWLVVLDGLERILVAYHRHDAAQLRDEEADTADQIGRRDPCAAIRPEDDDLLRRLSGVMHSKILVSSRLTPLALVNRAGIPVPGVRRENLSGLRPPDAEAMIRASGIRGRSQAIQAFLQTNTDCHPLVVGALAGLISNYPPDHGNFDRWADDLHHGNGLNLADVDLVQRRNHILLAAIDALAPEGRQLLQTLALLQGGADFGTLKALNPHLPPEPDKVDEPTNPADSQSWSKASEKDRARWNAIYKAELAARQIYVEALAEWKNNPAVQAALAKLGTTIRDLEKRGLLQYDLNDERYDLHPVVRAVVASRMAEEETRELGRKVVDYFVSRPHNPWEDAETLEDVASGLQIVRILLRMQRYEEALEAYRGELESALMFSLDAGAEIQALLRTFFPDGWDGEPVSLNERDVSFLLSRAAVALVEADPSQAWRLLERKLLLEIRKFDSTEVANTLQNLAVVSWNANGLARAAQLFSLSLEIAEAMASDQEIFVARLSLFYVSVDCGDHKTADRLWKELDGMGRKWSRTVYRRGDAEIRRVADLLYRGELIEEVLAQAEALAKSERNRSFITNLHSLRGEWHLTRDEPTRAIESLVAAVRMMREINREKSYAEALLALARLRAGDDFDARGEAERLSGTGDKTAIAVAELWQALGERDRAVEQALRAHRWAAADGEPYVHRYYLDRTRKLLADLGAELPTVSRFHASKVERYSWEKDVRGLIERLRLMKSGKAGSRSLEADVHNGERSSPR